MISNINNIRRYLSIIEKSFEDAENCATCTESCCDIFGNVSNKIYESLEELEEHLISSTDEEEFECCEEDCESFPCCNNQEINPRIFLTAFGNQSVDTHLAINFSNDAKQNENFEFFEHINPATLILKEVGYYTFEYFVMPKTANQTVALFLNDIEVDLSKFTNRSASEKILGKGIFYNDTPNAELKLSNVDDGTLDIEKGKLDYTVSAYLFVSKL